MGAPLASLRGGALWRATGRVWGRARRSGTTAAVSWPASVNTLTTLASATASSLSDAEAARDDAEEDSEERRRADREIKRAKAFLEIASS